MSGNIRPACEATWHAGRFDPAVRLEWILREWLRATRQLLGSAVLAVQLPGGYGRRGRLLA